MTNGTRADHRILSIGHWDLVIGAFKMCYTQVRHTVCKLATLD